MSSGLLNAGRTQNFRYDQLNRITSAWTSATTGNDAWGQTYSIDPWGNLWQQNTSQGSAPPMQAVINPNNYTNRLDSVGGAGLSYDASGNMIANGASTSYSWDAESQLKATAGSTYTYDAGGNRVRKESGAAPNLTYTEYIYWGAEPIAELDQNWVWTDYIFAGGKRVAQAPASAAAAGTKYYHGDHLGSAQLMTDTAGAVVFQATYLPFGYEFNASGSPPTHYKFTGKERDTESGLDYFGARYYTNGLGRWISPDWAAAPTGVPYADFANPQSLNLYGYVKNNPTILGDGDGHGDYYSPTGKLLGSDGVSDGAVHVTQSVARSPDGRVNAAATYDMYSVSKSTGNEIRASVDRSNSPAATSAGPDSTGGFHEEGFTVEQTATGEKTNVAPAGPVFNPNQAEASVNLRTNDNTTVVEHVHPAGTTSSNTFGGTQFQEGPSDKDVRKASQTPNAEHIVVNAGSKTVYFYDDRGRHAQVPLNAFPEGKIH